MTDAATRRLSPDTDRETPGIDRKLPLVLVTIGDELGEFEALYDHLECVARDPAPAFQSLIVTKPEVPEMLYNVLRARIADLPTVHVRRLADTADHCYEIAHETGTFLASMHRHRGGG